MANHAQPFALGQADREELQHLQRSPSTPAGLSRRARAVLLMADAVAGTEIARLTGYTPVQVSRIRRRFAEEGIEGLRDKPRSGRPAKITETKGARIVALTLKAPPKGLSHWSTRELADRVGVSHMSVHRLWQAHALKPHRLETFKFTTDPHAEQKIRDVVGLYLNPPSSACTSPSSASSMINCAASFTRSLRSVLPSTPEIRSSIRFRVCSDAQGFSTAC